MCAPYCSTAYLKGKPWCEEYRVHLCSPYNSFLGLPALCSLLDGPVRNIPSVLNMTPLRSYTVQTTYLNNFFLIKMCKITEHFTCFTQYFQILFRPVSDKKHQHYYQWAHLLQSSFFYLTVLESELVFLVLLMNCLGSNLITAQAKINTQKRIILVIKAKKNHME